MQNRNGEVEMAHCLAMGEATQLALGPASRVRIWNCRDEMLLYEAPFPSASPAVAPKALNFNLPQLSARKPS